MVTFEINFTFVSKLKVSKNILGTLNLILFLSSFILFTYNSFSFTRSNPSPDHIAQHFTSKQDAATDGSSQQLSEKNETENDEGSFELQPLSLHFIFSYFQFEISQPVVVTASPLAEKITHPIYVAIRNFRL